jgi:hypothetical protein
MRIMIMQKNDPRTEAGLPPSMELLTNVRAFIAELASTGRFVDGQGLSGSKNRTRLVFRDGRCTVRHGPYKGEHELPAAALHIKVGTREEAIGWGERYGKILGDGEIEVGKLLDPWDVGLMPPPENPPMYFLLVEKADAATGAGGRTPKQKAELTRLKTEMTKAGVLVKAIQLAPSATARRLVFTNDDLRVIDGPFSESKELIGGFLVMELSDVDEAIAVSRRYGEVLGGTLELDVHLVDRDDEPA